MYNLHVLPDLTVSLPAEETIDEFRVADVETESVETAETPAEIPERRRRQFNRGVHQEWRGDGWGN